MGGVDGTPQEAPQPKTAFENLYDQKDALNLTRDAKALVDMVQSLSISSENDKQNDDTLNVANMLGNEFERAISNLNLGEDQAKALIEELERIQNENGNNLSPDITQGIDDLIKLLTPQANPLLGNTIDINSIHITDNGFKYSLGSQRNEINQILTKFNQIDTLFGEGYNQLKSNLNTIKNYLNGQSITYGNTAKIITFLERSGVQPNGTIDYRNTTPIPQLVGMLNTFIEEIDNYRKGTLKGHNDVINKYRQQKEDNDRATQEQKEDFEEFRNLIMREKVSKLDRRIDPGEMENIKEYIRNKKIEDQNIVFELYDKMKILKFNDNDAEDQEIFDEIMKCIEDNYENEIGERDLNNLLGSKNIVDYYCSLDPDRNKDIDMNQGENGEFIQIGSDDYYQKIRQGDTINTICEGRDFTTNRFMEKFKEADTARMINNLRILKNSFDITTLIENGDQFNNDEEMVNKLLDKAATKFKETRGTNFLNDEDVTIFINMLEFPGIYLPENSALKTATDDVRTTRIDRINNYIEGHANIITEPLPALEETSINNKNLFKGLTAKTIADYYKEVSESFNNNQNIKELLTTLQEGLTSKPESDGSNNKIRKLQTDLSITGNANDGKFGPKTFESLQNRITTLLQQSQNSTDATINQNPAGSRINNGSGSGNLENGGAAVNGGNIENGGAAVNGGNLENSGATVNGESPEGGVETIVNYKQEALNLLNDSQLRELPGRQQIKSYMNSEDGIRYIQLCLLPEYKGKIDGKFGSKTLSALKTYINRMGNKGDNDNFMKNLSNNNTGNIINILGTPWNTPEKNFVAIKNGEHKYMINFVNGAEAELDVHNGESGIKKLKLKYTEPGGKVRYITMRENSIYIYKNPNNWRREYEGIGVSANGHWKNEYEGVGDTEPKQWNTLLEKFNQFT